MMSSIIEKIRRSFHSSDEGVTAIEYALIAALIAVVIIAGVALVGKNVNLTFNEVATHLPAN